MTQALTIKQMEAETPAVELPKRKVYEKELERLQIEMLKAQLWVKEEGERVAIVFEGRDAAGKGGAIRRVTEHANPRGARVVALPKPPTSSAASGASSATSRTRRRAARSCSTTAPGTTAQASSG